jgi:colicin import membrane protein
MTIFQKFSVSFSLALALHLAILAMFGINFSSENEVVRQKPLPELIQASVLDDAKIMEEAERLKTKQKNKQIAQNKRQQELENKRKKEQKLLQSARKKRLQEEKKSREQEKKRNDQLKKEKQNLEKIKKQKSLEAAKLAKIKKQKKAEEKRLNDQRKAQEKKRELAKQAKQKKQQELLAKQKAEAAEKAAQKAKQAAAAKAKKAEQAAAAKSKNTQNRQATISSTAAIQQKVNNRWIKPISSRKGLNCTIRVKLLPSGDVMDASVIRSSGDSVFDRSAENAVRKASPLPVPKDRELFAKSFRTFVFEFKPE